jgi:exopolysaccharide biosynthesis polyprenyl glycosylphosphotransferase
MVRISHTVLPARTLLLGLTEAAVAYLALALAAAVTMGNDRVLIPSHENGGIKLLIVCVICPLCFYYYDLYDFELFQDTAGVLCRIVQAVGTISILLAILYYFSPSLRIQAGQFVLGIILMGLCLAGWRKMFSAFSRSPGRVERAIVLGDGPLALPLAREIENRPELGLRLVKKVSKIGEIGQLEEIAEKEKISRVFVTMGDRRGALPVGTLLALKARGVVVEEASLLYESATGRVPLGSSLGSRLLFSPGFRISRTMLAGKRIFSLLVALTLAALVLPLMGAITLLIWLDCGRPVFFAQDRVGRGGRTFKLYKFRSMKLETETRPVSNGRLYTAAQDHERLTRVGRWLRRLRLDELPQLYNILRGDMDIVGPRPFMLEEEMELTQRIPFYKERWAVRPGASGWAQVRRPYCTTLEDNEEKLSYDLFYIKNMSLGFDLLIIFQTIKTMVLGRGSR